MEENPPEKLRRGKSPFRQIFQGMPLQVRMISDFKGNKKDQRPALHWMSPRNSSLGHKTVPYIQQEPAKKPAKTPCLYCGVYLVVLMIVACATVSGVLWAAWFPDVHTSWKTNVPEQTVTTKNSLSGRRVSNNRCAAAVSLIHQTRSQCGGIRLLSGNQTDLDNHLLHCRIVHYEARCLLFSLWYTDDPCPLVDIRRTVQTTSEESLQSQKAPNTRCSGLQAVLDLETLLAQPDSCQHNNTLYKMARRECSAMMNSIEGEGAGERTLCRNLKWLFHCMTTTLRDNQIDCSAITSRNHIYLAAVLFPYLSNDTLSRCSEPSMFPPCTGYLTERETRVFASCSAVLSLQPSPSSSVTHCKIYAYMTRCVQRGLSNIGTSCSVQNIIRRLERDLRRVPDVNPTHIKECLSFIEDYDQDDVCLEEDILDMVAHSFCTTPESQPFRLTKTKTAISPVFSQCSNFSAAVTCVSEYLTSVDISCHPARLETVMEQAGYMPEGSGPEFNMSQCNDVPGERLCSDGQSILQITGDTCNVVLDFIQQQPNDNFKCSYFRQFVSCVQALLQSRGYECFFNRLQRTLTQEHTWFDHRSAFDPSYCSDPLSK